MTVEGDTKLIHSQKGDTDSVLTRELTDDSTLTLVSSLGCISLLLLRLPKFAQSIWIGLANWATWEQ